MGRTICAAVAADPDLVFVAGVDPGGAGESISGVTVDEHLHAFADARRRRRRRLHRGRAAAEHAAVARRCTASTPWSARPGSRPTTSTLFEPTFVPPTARTASSPQLRHLRGADDALRRDGGAVLRHRRDHRAAPRPQDRRPVGHRDDDGRADGRGAATGTVDPIRRTRGRVRAPAGGAARPGSTSHSVRMRGMVAHQEVILGATGQTLDDPPGQLRPRQLHARRAARLQTHRHHPGSHPLPRPVPHLTFYAPFIGVDPISCGFVVPFVIEM